MPVRIMLLCTVRNVSISIVRLVKRRTPATVTDGFMPGVVGFPEGLTSTDRVKEPEALPSVPPKELPVPPVATSVRKESLGLARGT